MTNSRHEISKIQIKKHIRVHHSVAHTHLFIQELGDIDVLHEFI